MGASNFSSSAWPSRGAAGCAPAGGGGATASGGGSCAPGGGWFWATTWAIAGNVENTSAPLVTIAQDPRSIFDNLFIYESPNVRRIRI
jgi:hypothetical protein